MSEYTTRPGVADTEPGAGLTPDTGGLPPAGGSAGATQGSSGTEGSSGAEGSSGTQGSGGTKDKAMGAAKDVAGTAKDEASSVADTTKQQVGEVAGEAKDQARQLWQQSRQELMDQTGQQQQRVAGSLRTLSDDLSSMSRSSESSGVADSVVREVSDRASTVADWLENRDPGSLLDETRRFARQRPGAFLAIAAGVGLLGGRLSRAMVDESRDDGPADQTSTVGSTGTYPTADAQTAGMDPYATPAGSVAGVAPAVPSVGGDPLLPPETGGGISAPGSVGGMGGPGVAGTGLQEPR